MSITQIMPRERRIASLLRPYAFGRVVLLPKGLKRFQMRAAHFLEKRKEAVDKKRHFDNNITT